MVDGEVLKPSPVLCNDAMEEAHKEGLPIFLWGNIPHRDPEKLHSIFSIWGLLSQPVEQYQ
eukprot:1147022-Amphidinium_carterae.1